MKMLNNLTKCKKMKKMNIIKWFVVVWIGVLSFSSCNDVWDEHYSNNSGDKSDLSLTAYIESQADLSIFAQMLKISGYDSILAKPQTYTVWAPVNSVLSQVDLTDTLAVKNLVINHITRFSHPTSNLNNKTIYMLDKKFISFGRANSGFTFGGKELIQDKSNIAVANGILHVINGYVPYMENIWEYITKAQDMDSLRNFLLSESEYLFDVKASVEIGTNEYGQAVYDSVITFSNSILDKIGHLHIEDSVYSTLLPNNKAWTDAYNKVKSNYKTLPADGGAAKQRYYSQLALVKNLVFRKVVSQPESEDSLVSTTGNIFKTPGYLFTGAMPVNLSNGMAYVTDSLRYKAAETWQQPIILEAENSSYGRKYDFANLFVRSSLGSAFDKQVSDDKYLLVEPTTVSNTTMSAVTFPIPNTLSGKYRIYCVMVPTNIIADAVPKANKLKFFFSYLTANGTAVVDAPVDATNKLLAPGKVGGIFTSEADKISKMFVTQFEFPYCNILEAGDPSSKITIKLKVENAVKINETVKFSRIMRIDYIILEPVQ